MAVAHVYVRVQAQGTNGQVQSIAAVANDLRLAIDETSGGGDYKVSAQCELDPPELSAKFIADFSDFNAAVDKAKTKLSELMTAPKAPALKRRAKRKPEAKHK